MKTKTILAPSFHAAAPAELAPMTMTVRIGDHDVREIAIGFGRKTSERSLPLGSSSARSDRRELGSIAPSTIAGVTYRRTDPLREPLRVADERLQLHLEELCEALRAKY